MRLFKFRVWDETQKKMLFFNNIFNKHPATETSTFPQYESFLNFHDVKIMQWSGLIDKNGKEIYEGDIVESKSNMVHIATGIKTGEIVIEQYIIVWEEDKAMFNTQKIGGRNTNFNLNQDQMTEYYEVVGNIFENLNFINDKKKEK